jgi:hypothetical protein
LVSLEPLPDCVCYTEGQSIDWIITADGQDISAGSTGDLDVYVTFDTPGGKMECPSDNKFAKSGPAQVVTVPRLRWAIRKAWQTGVNDEKECVDEIFLNMKAGYFLGRRWIQGDENPAVGVHPNPSLHHYLWLCNVVAAWGECHNIAAGFALACRILGVQDPFEVGYMHPWPSRNDDHPNYTKRNDGVLGKYKKPYRRTHSYQSHGQEKLVFLDQVGGANYFEGVAKYRQGLYAIGDQRFDTYETADENASSYFMVRTGAGNKDGISQFIEMGGFSLAFSGDDWCYNPYPNVVQANPGRDPNAPEDAEPDGRWAGSFKWED